MNCCFAKSRSTFPEQKIRRPHRTVLQTRPYLFSVDLVVFRMWNYAWKTNFWCHILIDGLITNEIALLLPVHERTEFGKMFGIDYRRFLSAPPPSYPLPSHFSPTFLLTPGMLLHSLVRSPRRLEEKSGTCLWNNLPQDLKSVCSIGKFKQGIKKVSEISDSHTAIM